MARKGNRPGDPANVTRDFRWAIRFPGPYIMRPLLFCRSALERFYFFPFPPSFGVSLCVQSIHKPDKLTELGGRPRPGGASLRSVSRGELVPHRRED